MAHSDFHRETKIADVGSGYGVNIALLSNYGKVFALELDDGCRALIEDAYPNVQAIKWSSPERLPVTFDIILHADVWEHIEEDRLAIGWICDHLNDGRRAYITVPAHNHLWSEMNDVLHHFRRYNKPLIRDVVPNQLMIEKASYYNAICTRLSGCLRFKPRLKA